MSYGLSLFTPSTGLDPREIADREEMLERGPRDPAVEAKKRKVVSALIAHDPRLEIFAPDFDKIAALHQVPVTEAHARMRRIKLNADRESGIQIGLFDDCASLTIPYWHASDRARSVLEQVWGYIGIIAEEFGYEVFDRQLDRVIDVHAFEEVFASYLSATARMQQLIGRPPQKRPWWKIW